jgi:surface polysaccharide O-acyltransferase-like enzyme
VEHVGQEAASYPVMQLSITILPNSFAAFELLRRANKPLISIKFTNKLAELTLGIYTIHRVVISLMAIAGFPASRYHLLVCIPISAACVFALSALLTWVLSSIPYLKRLV